MFAALRPDAEPAPAPLPQSRARLARLLPPELVEGVLDFLGYEAAARAQMLKVCRHIRWNREFQDWRHVYSKIIRAIPRHPLRCKTCRGHVPFKNRLVFKDYCRARCEAAGWFRDTEYHEYARDHAPHLAYSEALDDFVYAHSGLALVRHFKRPYGAPYHYDSAMPYLAFTEERPFEADQPVGFGVW